MSATESRAGGAGCPRTGGGGRGAGPFCLRNPGAPGNTAGASGLGSRDPRPSPTLQTCASPGSRLPGTVEAEHLHCGWEAPGAPRGPVSNGGEKRSGVKGMGLAGLGHWCPGQHHGTGGGLGGRAPPGLHCPARRTETLSPAPPPLLSSAGGPHGGSCDHHGEDGTPLPRAAPGPRSQRRRGASQPRRPGSGSLWGLLRLPAESMHQV